MPFKIIYLIEFKPIYISTIFQNYEIQLDSK